MVAYRKPQQRKKEKSKKLRGEYSSYCDKIMAHYHTPYSKSGSGSTLLGGESP